MVRERRWQLKKIGDLVLLNPESLSNRTADDTIIKYIDIASIEKTGRISEPKKLAFRDAPSRARRIVCEGDTIVSTVRPYLKAFAYIDSNFHNNICSTGFAVLRPNKDVISGFVYQTILRDDFIKYLKTKMTGSNYPAVNASDISEYELLVPPHSEQGKIAEILASFDNTISKTEAIIENTEKVKKGLIQQLLTKGIGHTKFKETEIGEIPEEWNIKSFRDIFSVIKSGISRRFISEDIGYPVIRSTNIANWSLDLTDLKYWHLLDDQGSNLSNLILMNDDLLINFINSLAQIGKCCMFDKQERDFIYSTNIFRVQLKPNLLINKFFFYYTQSKRYETDIQNITKPAVNQASFTKADFENLLFALPPLSEQIRIIESLNSIDCKVKNEQQKLTQLQTLKKGLMQVLLTGKVRVNVDESEAVNI